MLMQGISRANPKVELKIVSEALDQAINIEFASPADTHKVFILEKLTLLQYKAGNTISAEKIIQHAIATIEELNKDPSPMYATLSNPADLLPRLPHELELNVPYTFYLLMRIADLQVKIGNSMGALATLQKASGLVGDICKDMQKIGCLQQIAVRQARAGDQDSSSSTLQKLIKSESRLKNQHYFEIQSILAVAQAQAERGEKASALASLNQALSKVDDSKMFPYLDEVLRDASLVAARLGSDELLEDLLKKAFVAIDQEAKRRSFSAETAKVILLVDISKVQPPDRARQSIRKALNLAQTTPDEKKSVVYMEITVAQAQLNDLREVRDSFGQIEDKEYRGIAAPHLAEAMIRAGEIDEAFKLVNEVTEPDRPRRLRILKDVGVAKAERGDIESAIQISRRIAKLGTDSYLMILSAVGKQKAKSLPPAEALAWAKSQSPGVDQIYALMGVAEGLLEKAAVD
jgi:tetratricopeptide (TPR) repeat protein